MAAYIGVTVAILGNICISVALNIQKHVHNNLAENAAAAAAATVTAVTTVTTIACSDEARQPLLDNSSSQNIIMCVSDHNDDDFCYSNAAEQHDEQTEWNGNRLAAMNSEAASESRADLTSIRAINRYRSFDDQETSSHDDHGDWLASRSRSQVYLTSELAPSASITDTVSATSIADPLLHSIPHWATASTTPVRSLPGQHHTGFPHNDAPVVMPHGVYHTASRDCHLQPTTERALDDSNLHIPHHKPYAGDTGVVPETAYLRERLWWIGMGIMLLGELGNFSAYGFAPAVLVAPLGTVALISNALIAPIFLGETLRSRDIFGILFAMLGTGIILAVSSQTSEPPLSADDIVAALTQPQFFIYFIVTSSLAGVMLVISYAPQGRKYILVDLLIVALFGGYTVLATKALSSLLKLSFLTLFGHWVTYLMLFVLVSTAVLQVQHLNRALSAFDSVEVIPTNFVLFTTSSIVGSSILYNDLQRTNSLALLGVVCMFFGVVLITGRRNSNRDKDSALLDDNGVDIQNESPRLASRHYHLPYYPIDLDLHNEADVYSEEANATASGYSAGALSGVNGVYLPRQASTPIQITHSPPLPTSVSSPALLGSAHISYPHTHTAPSHFTPKNATTSHLTWQSTQVSSLRGQPYPQLASLNTVYATMAGARLYSHSNGSPTGSIQSSLCSGASGHSKHGSGEYGQRRGAARLGRQMQRGGSSQGAQNTRYSKQSLAESLPTRMADATLKHISTVFQSFGTHQIRRIELDCMTDVHGGSSSNGGNPSLASTVHGSTTGSGTGHDGYMAFPSPWRRGPYGSLQKTIEPTRGLNSSDREFSNAILVSPHCVGAASGSGGNTSRGQRTPLGETVTPIESPVTALTSPGD
ncbi:hypothetical protein BASA50_001549 [Batrachochytrium salamandrivorans]|uniref:EamA domain-containing protein n=1 Tax=Batrachochytrium salamandrivorans TaxID=1357716 RepID=A0ABQ8FRN6_9FUNG|nr:hypothetical protein BASA50_001549 [Batrachochytrium salamandrivorans]